MNDLTIRAQDETSEMTDELRSAFEDAGQGHVFRFWDDLNADERDALVRQLSRIDLDLVGKFARGEAGEATVGGTLSPAPVLALDEEPAGTTRAAARERGEALLHAGKVGVFLVAGGQGSRLGFEGPKGCFPAGPLSSSTLFEQHASKISRLRQRFGAAIPWYIMTSQANDEATRAFFESHDFFGLPSEDVLFLPQAMLPALDANGKLLLASRSSLFMSPDGHGGSYEAFARGGLAHAEARGLEHLFYFQVDNPLIRIADPFFVGLHDLQRADMSLKVLTKTGPEEKIGVVALCDGRPTVVEYSDLGESDARLERDGKLVFGSGSIAIHAFRIDFVRKVAQGSIRLPYHVAQKKIQTIDASGETITVDGRKFETFVFDALPFASRFLNVEVAREAEFGPIKNASGVDSVDTARALLMAEHRRWLAGCGIDARGDVEISPLVAVDAEDLAERVSAWRGHVSEHALRVELDELGNVVLNEAPAQS